MKKYLKLIGLSLMATSLLVACDNDSGKKGENVAEEENARKENKDLKIENEVSFVYQENENPVVFAGTYGAEIKNKGKKPILVDNVVIDFNNFDNQPISHFEFVQVIPNILEPGETGFVVQNTILPGIIAENGVKGINVQLYGEKTNQKQALLDVNDVAVELTENENYPYNVHGKVVNNTGKDIGSATVYAGLYDDKGNFYGVLTGAVAPEKEPMEANKPWKDKEELKFTLSYPTLSKDVKGKVTKAKVYAVAQDFVEEDPVKKLKEEVDMILEEQNIPPHIINQILTFKDEASKYEFLNSIENEVIRAKIKEELEKKASDTNETKESTEEPVQTEEVSSEENNTEATTETTTETTSESNQ